MTLVARLLTPCAALLGLLASCGGAVEAGAPAGTGRVVRLEPTPLLPRPAGDIELAAHFAVEGPELPEGWSFATGADEGEVVHEVQPRYGGPWFGATAPGAKAFTVRIAGPHDPASFNRVALHLATRDKVDVALALHRKGGQTLRTPYVRYAGDGQPTTVMIDVFETIRFDGAFDSLAVQVRCIKRAPAILGVDLLRTSVTALAPEGGRAGAPVSVRGETRAAWGLPLGHPLEARATPTRGTLRFGYARPPGLSDPKQKLSIRVVFEGSDGRLGAQALTVPSSKPRDEWLEARVPIPDAAVGREISIRFELLSNSERAAAAVISSPRIETPGADPPTVVLVTSDTHRADHLGAAGERGVGVATPFLDSLAAEGVYFANCYSSTNITNPSHGAILTALPIRDTGINDNITALSPDALTLAEAFQAGGWLTVAAVSAGHMNHTQSGLGQGFDRMDYPARGDRDSAETLARLTSMVSEAEGVPLFAWLHVFDAHGPYEVPEEFRWLYYDRGRDPYAADLPPLPDDAQPPWDRQARDLEYVLGQYKAEVTYLDGTLARFFEIPRMKRAIVAVTADHGECLGEQGEYYTHQPLLPATLDVPLILRWPDAPAGTRVDAPVRNIDVGRTLLDLADLANMEFPGRNLLGWIEGSASVPRTRFAISSHGTTAVAEEDGWYLLLRLSTSSRGPVHEVELYHVAEDPECRVNLLDAEFERARDLRAKLLDWLDAAPAQRLSVASGAADAESLAELAELGYADDATGAGQGPWYVPDPDDPWCRRFER